jgi:hypothetical protein
MTAPIRQPVPLPASDEAADVRRSAAGHDRAMDVGVLPAKPRHAGCGAVNWISQGRLFCGAQLRDTRWQARRRSVADLTGLPFPRLRLLSVPARRGKPIRARVGNVALGGPQAAAMHAALPVIGMLAWFEVHDTVEHCRQWRWGAPTTRFSCAAAQPRFPLAARQRAPAPSGALSELHCGAARYERRRHGQPRHAHDHILGAHQRAAILPPCPASGQRRGTL